MKTGLVPPLSSTSHRLLFINTDYCQIFNVFFCHSLTLNTILFYFKTLKLDSRLADITEIIIVIITVIAKYDRKIILSSINFLSQELNL